MQYNGFQFNLNNRKGVDMKNMGAFDRVFRTLVAILIGVLYYMGVISGTLAIVLGILAVVFLLTSLVSTCPLYMPFGLSTRKQD